MADTDATSAMRLEESLSVQKIRAVQTPCAIKKFGAAENGDHLFEYMYESYPTVYYDR
jgi:hypothetical protein